MSHFHNQPVYSTAQTHAMERDLARQIGWAWNCTLKYLGQFSPIDFSAWRGERQVGWLEVKADRTRWRSDDPRLAAGVFLALDKAEALWRAYRTTRLPALFFVRFQDRMVYLDIGDYPAPFQPAPVRLGRRDRPNDPKALEPMCLVPHDLFREFQPSRSQLP